MKRMALVAMVAAALGASSIASAAVLDDVKQRGVLACGVSQGVAGFSAPSPSGQWSGLDVDLCRALAAAIFDNAEKIRFVPLATTSRFTAVQSGEVDLLSRITTWTLSRDTSLGLAFSAVNYYDGQAFITRKSLNVKSAKELGGASICAQTGSTTELNLADFFRSNNLRYEPLTLATIDEVISAYDAGRCDAYTTDASGLYSARLRMAKPDDHVVLPDIISKEPLGPAVRQGDHQWFNLVRWTHYAMVTAEELGVSTANVDQMLSSTNPEIRRLLGLEGSFGESLGLTKDWAYRIVKRVGNYGEAFERNVGAGSPLKIERGLNALWNKGGLQYAPPIR